METKTSQEFRIPDSNFTALKERVAKLNKKAQKLMGVEITLNVARVVDVEKLIPVRRNPEAPGGWDMRGTGEFNRFHMVTITGPVVKLAGWKFVGALDIMEADGEKMVLVRNASDEAVPETYRKNVNTNCDHCKVSRNRKTLYVLKKEGGTVDINPGTL
jgi:hypothetical protein